MPSRRALLISVGAVLMGRRATAREVRLTTVGVVRINPPSSERFVDQFRNDMAALGWLNGHNVRFEVRFSDGSNERVVANTAELVAHPVDVLLTFGNFATAAAQRATARIPIVAMNNDMVGSGLVESWIRPGGNTTGVSVMGTELDVKRLELLHDLVPEVHHIAVLVDPSITTPAREARLADAARGFGVELAFFRATSLDELGQALHAMATAGVGSVNVLASPMLNGGRALIIEQLHQARLPAVYEWPETAEEGGVMGYGARITRVYRQVAVLVDKVLRGARRRVRSAVISQLDVPWNARIAGFSV